MAKSNSVLIAGATGLVGKALVNKLLDQGYKVHVLTRNIATAQKLLPSEVVLLKWPDANEKLLMSHCDSCEAVINLAGANIGAHRWTKSYKQQILNSRIKSIQQMESIVSKMPSPPKVWIQASAIGYYGCNVVTPIDESGKKGDGFLASVVDELETTLNNISLNNMRKVVLRFGIVMTYEGGFLDQMKKLFNLGLGVIPSNGTQHISWIHLDDLIAVILEGFRQEKMSGAYNVVSPNSISFQHFAQFLKQKSLAIALLKMPAFLFRFVLGKSKTDEMLLANQKIIPRRLQETGFDYKYPGIQDFI